MRALLTTAATAAAIALLPAAAIAAPGSLSIDRAHAAVKRYETRQVARLDGNDPATWYIRTCKRVSSVRVRCSIPMAVDAAVDNGLGTPQNVIMGWIVAYDDVVLVPGGAVAVRPLDRLGSL